MATAQTAAVRVPAAAPAVPTSNRIQYRPANLARVAYSAAFTAFLFLVGQDGVAWFGSAHLFFACGWLSLSEAQQLEGDQSGWRSGYLPATFDAIFITLLVYVTGNIRSFMIIGYFLSISLSSMVDRRPFGTYVALLSSSLFTLMGALVYLQLIPNVNVVMATAPVTLVGLGLSSLSMLVSFVVVNRIISSLFTSLSAEIRARKISQDRLERDLHMARRVQESILPDADRVADGTRIQLGSHYLALDSVGGDLFDVLDLGPDRFAFVIADVSGHGVPSALITTMAKAMFHSVVADDDTPGAILEKVNARMYAMIGDLPYYLTAFCLVIDLGQQTYAYSSAAHPPGIRMNRHSLELQELESENSFFLGVMPEFNFETFEAPLATGDRFVLYTDGIVEAHNPEREMFDYERLRAAVRGTGGLGTREFVQSLVSSVAEFSVGAPAEDDQAILCIDYDRDSR